MPGVIDALTVSGGQPAAGGLDQQRAELEAKMGQLRDLDAQVQTVFNDLPALAPIGNQIRTLIRQAVRESVKMAPTQTASGAAVPTAGM